jgi:hypothetical protein
MDLSQSLASISSTAWEKVGGLVRWKSPNLSLDGDGGAWGWAACMLTMVYCMVWSISACIASTFSKVDGGGGGGLAPLLFFFSPLFSILLVATRFLMLAIWSLSIDEIKNTQKNDSMVKRIVENTQRYEITKWFILNFIYKNCWLKCICETGLTIHQQSNEDPNQIQASLIKANESLWTNILNYKSIN